MTNPVVNIDSVQFEQSRSGTRYAAPLASFTERLGARKLGCQLTVVPSGKCALRISVNVTDDFSLS